MRKITKGFFAISLCALAIPLVGCDFTETPTNKNLGTTTSSISMTN